MPGGLCLLSSGLYTPIMVRQYQAAQGTVYSLASSEEETPPTCPPPPLQKAAQDLCT